MSQLRYIIALCVVSSLLFVLEIALDRHGHLNVQEHGRAGSFATANQSCTHSCHDQGMQYLAPLRGGTLVDGIEQKEKLLRTQGYFSNVRNGLVVDGWTSLGPTPSRDPNGFEIVSGMVNAIKYDPINPWTVYLGGACGGVWKSTDAGKTWVPKSDYIGNLTAGSIAIDPGNTNIVYFGTGKWVSIGLVAQTGRGFFKSTNGGESWTRYASGLPALTDFRALVIRPNHSNELLAAMRSCSGGIYRSTNAGVSWTRVVQYLPDNDAGMFADDVAFSPAGDTAYAIGKLIGYQMSTDGGATFHEPTAHGLQIGDHRAKVAVCPSQPNVVYVATATQGEYEIKVFKSTNGGATFFTMPAIALGSWLAVADYCFILRVDPENPDNVYVGNYDLYRSTNGGVSFEKIGGYNTEVHPDFQSFDFNPYNSQEILVGSDGGVWHSTDMGNTWDNRNRTLSLTQFYSIAVDPFDSRNIIGGTQDNMYQHTRGNPEWTIHGMGDGYASVFHPVDYGYALVYTNGGFRRSTDGGDSWHYTGLYEQPLSDGNPRVRCPVLLGHPTQEGVFYAGVQRLWWSTDWGASWNQKSAQNTLGQILALAVSKSSPNVMFAATDSVEKRVNGEDTISVWVGKILKSTDGGAHFIRLKTEDWGFFSSIRCHPDSADVAIAVRLNDAPGKLIHTNDGGITWFDISGNLPNLPATDVVIWAPDHSKTYYIIGTDAGVYITEDYGQHWYELAPGLPNSPVFSLDMNERSGKLRAGTYGRGVFEVTLALPSSNIAVCTATDGQEKPVITSDGAGGAIVAWRDYRGGNTRQLYAQRLNFSQTLWAANGVRLTSQAINSPVTCSDGAGGAIIAWKDNSYPGNLFYAQRIDASGTVQWGTNGYNVGGFGGTSYQICSDGAGGAIFVWASSAGDIYASRVSYDRHLLWGGVAVCTAADSQLSPQVCTDGANGAIITWKDYRNGTTNADIYAQRVNATGQVLWAANGIPVCTASGYQSAPVMSSDGSGGAIIAWCDYRYQYPVVGVQQLNASGEVPSPWPVNGKTITAGSSPSALSICTDGVGGAIIAYQTEENIYAHRINAATLTWGSRVGVCTAIGVQQLPQVCSAGAGGAIVTWQDERSGEADVYAQALDAAGNAQWLKNGMLSSGALNKQIEPVIAGNGAGGALLAWCDYRGSTADIYAQGMGRYGILENDTLVNAKPMSSLIVPGFYKFNQRHVNWSVVGVRSSPDADHNLFLFSDPSYASLVASSEYGINNIDFIVADHNHSPLGYLYPKVILNSGSGAYTLNWEDSTETLLVPGTTDVAWAGGCVTKVWDVWLEAGKQYVFNTSGAYGGPEFSTALFKSNGAAYYAGRSSAVRVSNRTMYGEQRFAYTAPVDDWYGFVLWINNTAGGTYQIEVGEIVPLASGVSRTGSEADEYFSFNQQSDHWSVAGIRKSAEDNYQLSLYGDSLYTRYLASSSSSLSTVDFVVGDHHHGSLGLHFPEVSVYEPEGGFTVEWENGADIISAPGTSSTIPWQAANVVKVWDTFLHGGRAYKFVLDMISGSTDVGIALYSSDEGPHYMPDWCNIGFADDVGNGSDENFIARPLNDDWYGLVVWANNAGNSSFNIRAYELDFIADLQVLDNCLNDTINLSFGTAPSCSDDYDSGIDQYAPPPAPAGAFDARLRVGANDLLTDVRRTINNFREWDVFFQPGSSCNPVTLSWDPLQFPSVGSLHLRDAVTGNLVNVDMRSEYSYTDNLNLRHLQIVYTPQTTFNKAVAAGWNMISLGNEPTDRYYLSWFPSANPGTLFWFNGIYCGFSCTNDSFAIGKGYWLRFPTATTQSISGSYVSSTTIPMFNGWNMIGGVSCNLPLASVSDPGNIIVSGTLYSFDAGYHSSDTIKAGVGYWLKTRAAGTLYLNCTALPKPAVREVHLADLRKSPSLTIADASGASQVLHFNVALKDSSEKLSFSLPPIPPSGMFDARFEGDYRAIQDDASLIHIQSANYPLTISASNVSVNGKAGYSIVEVLGSADGKTHTLDAGSRITISNTQVKMLRLKKVQTLPLVFAVEQNYPNPFNPTTTIRFALPKPSHVQLDIYNTIGQRVATLVNEVREAGYYNEVFDARNIASGVYFYHMQAGSFSDVKKMLLIK